MRVIGVTRAALPSANFEPLPWVSSFEETGLVLAHNSLASAQRIIKLNDPHMTGLSRFLGIDQTRHAFGAMEKSPVALAMENKELAMPVSVDYLPAAGDIENMVANALRVVERVRQQIDNRFTLLDIERIHADQAIDLRRQQQPVFTLSPATAGLYIALPGKLAFFDRDPPLTPDFRAAATLLHSYPADFC
ncbi:aromatic amino acid lyase [Caballeronia sp. LjRoot34]|uniref:aromatic amino acid lyase n=1 Tax=Caballeronia sp. LjRoot34 TaxID=3342325 RepID=UPI003ECDC2C6